MASRADTADLDRLYASWLTVEQPSVLNRSISTAPRASRSRVFEIRWIDSLNIRVETARLLVDASLARSDDALISWAFVAISETSFGIGFTRFRTLAE